MVFTQNHDQVGNRPIGDRLDRAAGLEGARAAAALVLLSPFTPMLWMGEEYAEPAPFQYFVSHNDAALIRAVQQGRAEEFADFQTPGGVPDPQDEATFLRSGLAWNLRDRGQHAQTLAYYAELLRLRRALDIPGRSGSVVASAQAAIVRLEYPTHPRVLIIANTGDAPGSVDPASGDPEAFDVLLASNDARWGGVDSPPHRESPLSGAITIGAKTALVLRAAQESQ